MKQIDTSTIIACFHAMLLSIYVVVAALHLPIDVSALIPPTDVLAEIVEEMIAKYNITGVWPSKRASDGDGGGSSVPKKRKHVRYDRARAYNAVMDDWLSTSPLPRFDDRQFERVYRLKRHMVDNIINNLACYNSIWIQTNDATNICHPQFTRMSSFWRHGRSYYFQMGESTARLCVHHLACCPGYC